MNKKLKCLLMAALMLVSSLLCFTGCNKIRVEINLEEIAAANKTDEILKHYDSFMVKAEDGERTVGYYAESGFVFEWSGAYKTATTSYKEYHEIIADNFYCGMNGDDFYSIVYAGGKMDTAWTDDLMINPDLFTKETVISSKEEDGVVTFKTRLTEEVMVELGYWQAELYKGCYYETVYTMDKDTKIITHISETFVDKTSKNKSTLEYTLTVDVERPEKAKTIYEHATATSETCTATVVFDPNTENEKRESFTVPKGDTVYFYWEGDYNKVYKNPELTDVLSSSHVNLVADGDIAIYLTKTSK
jgi:hypothetical protein